MINFIEKLSKPKVSQEILENKLLLSEDDGDNAEEIFINGTDFTEAEIALEARKILKKVL